MCVTSQTKRMNQTNKKIGKDNQMEITKSQAISVFKALKFNSADKWDVKKLQGKLKKLPILAEGIKVSAEMKPRIKKLCDLVKKGKKISVVDPATAKSDAKLDKDIKKSKASKKESKKAKVKKAKKAKTPRYNRISSVVAVLKNRKKITTEELIVAADKDYIANGGSGNPKESQYAVNKVLATLTAWGAVKMDENTVCRAA